MLGVLGGMGPLATVDFLAKLNRATPAQRDEDHVPVVVWSVPQIPSRTAAILSGGPSPLPHFLQALDVLLHAGAEAIAIPCNTAHYWAREMRQHIAPRPLLHIVDAAIAALPQGDTRPSRLGLLAAPGMLRFGIYQQRFRELGIDVLQPSPDSQPQVMRGIEHVKAARIADARALLAPLADELLERGAEAVVMACTEIPIALAGHRPERMVDATDALALAAARWWMARVGTVIPATAP